MDLATSDICEVVRNVWDCVLGLPVVPAAPHVEWQADERLLGAISISGEWTGVIVLQASRAAAFEAARRMFPDEAEQLSEVDIRDALAELTNIVGGNIKSLVPGPSSLALPGVTTGDNVDLRLLHASLICEPLFLAAGHPVRIAIWANPSPANLRDYDPAQGTRS